MNSKMDLTDKLCAGILIVSTVYFGGHFLWFLWRFYGI